uniref:Uncharacterized protein LOC100182710 n=1 Tax=Phallusia mammillata TaxID=59560 RepID=A0A6F9DI91_9ASCI|nr:uncharacterized protein LOC100182710 [Phallusia mammillata]
MSRKWNPFRKHRPKADSHGTTSANEDIEFQPAPIDQESHWSSSSGSTRSRELHSDDPDLSARRDSGQKHAGLPSVSAGFLNAHNETAADGKRSKHYQNHAENGGMRYRKDSLSSKFKDLSHSGPDSMSKSGGKNNYDSTDNGFGSEPSHLVSAATITRTSPRAPKKLIKPGEINAPQPAYLSQQGNSNLGLSVSDEYTDPFDAVHAKGRLQMVPNEQSAVDGYIEPYEAQQMYHDVTQSSAGLGEMKASLSDSTDLQKKKLYDDPWDRSGQARESKTDYEEPWDNSNRVATLPYSSKKPSSRQQHEELVLEYPNMPSTGSLHGSGDSSASSSSASLAKQRMVKVERSPRNSPRSSPRHSPKLDRRLIRPQDPRNQLYSAPGGGKYRPVDQRLIKAEPSLEELRRNSPGGTGASSRASSVTNSPMSSSRGSPNRSPMNTLSQTEAADQACEEALRRASSPLVQPMNVSHHLLNKAKSRSLDIRNRQYMQQSRPPRGAIPKSASDDQLMQAALMKAHYHASQPLGGVTEYEEPWDTGESKSAHSKAHVSHSRSRSYELNSSYSYAALQPRHSKSHSFDKPALPEGNYHRHPNYEQPWDQQEVVPHGHLESMQRFQERRLELHPSEAISDRDCDPLLPLERQCWFHGAITRDEANQRLETEVEGSYLVRKSESIRNNFSLSLRTRTETIHMVISRTRDGMWILGEFSAPFHSVPEMVAHYATHRLKINEAHHISLSYPVSEYL